MPHSEAVPTNPMPTVVAKGPSGVPPSDDEVSSFLKAIFDSDKSQESLDAAYGLTNVLIQSTGTRGLRGWNILQQIKKAATDKKSGARRESSMLVLGALFERFPSEYPLSEVVFLIEDGGLLHLALDCLADKGAVVREAARYAVDALFACVKEESLVAAVLPSLSRYLEKSSAKWQGAVGALKLMEKMANKAQIGTESKEKERLKDLLRDSMGRTLKDLIPVVESGMHDLKGEVSKQAVKTMTALATLLDNDDVAPRIPLLINTMENPSTETLQQAIHALSQTTFVAEVTSPVLALLTPLLERSLNTPTTSQEVLRQTVVAVENLTRLVHDPIEARTFLPKLKPGVQRVKDAASLPEVRELATRTLSVVQKAMGEDNGVATNGTIEETTTQNVLGVLEQQVKACGGLSDGEAQSFWNSAKSYISEMVRHDANNRFLERIPLCIGPYLRELVKVGQHDVIAAAVQKHYVEEDERKYGVPPKDDDGEVEIVNADFSLGYGGRLLLSHANLRLLKGHRYGLCGRNGVGKSTLMRSIAEGKLEGFPPRDVLRTCFVEHNQGEDADLSVLKFISQDPELASAGAERISAALTEVGFTPGPEGTQQQAVGSLSGGWKMKLALARAMIMQADVLLLDEPTNHLDVANVQWLQDYLKQHTDITSLIVSHDSSFLDAVCTDIYHYEQKKLVCYKGNLDT